MAQITEREISAIHDTHDKVIKIEAILGNNHKGLLSTVDEHRKRIRRVELFIAGLIGSGALGGGIIGLIKIIGS